MAMLAAVAAAAERLLQDRLSAGLLVIIVATTGAVLSITSIHGLSDGWFLWALIAIAAGRGRTSLILPGLLGLWVDERFLLGWPLALFCRWWLQERPPGFLRQILLAGAALLPCVFVRLGLSFWSGDRGSADFIGAALTLVPEYAPYLRLAAWMGYRCAWVLVALALWQWWHAGGRTVFMCGAGSLLAGWLAVTLLAADLTRSTNLLRPALVCGAAALRTMTPSAAESRRWLAGIAAANLVLPYLTVIQNKTMLHWSLPLELLRLWKN